MTLELARGREIYDPVEHERFVNRLIREFDRDFLARLEGAGLETRRPVFVFGLPRSGTTLIEQVLASHSQIHGAGELRLARRSFNAIPALLGRSGPPRDSVAHLDRASARTLAEQHLGQLISGLWLVGRITRRSWPTCLPRCHVDTDRSPAGLSSIVRPRVVFDIVANATSILGGQSALASKSAQLVAVSSRSHRCSSRSRSSMASMAVRVALLRRPKRM